MLRDRRGLGVERQRRANAGSTKDGSQVGRRRGVAEARP